MTQANPRFDYQHAIRVFIIFFVLLQIVFVAIYTSRTPGIVDALKFNFWYAVVLSLLSTLYLSYSNRLCQQSYPLTDRDEVLKILRRNTIRKVKIKESTPVQYIAGFGFMSAPVNISILKDEILFTGPKHFIVQLAAVLKLTEN